MSLPPMNRRGSRRIFSFLLAGGLFWSLATGSTAAPQAEPRAKPISPSSTTEIQDASAKPSAKDKPSGETKPETGAFVIATASYFEPGAGIGSRAGIRLYF